MTDKIRLWVWLAGLGPIVVVGGVGVYLLMPRDKPGGRPAPATASEPAEQVTPAVAALPTPTFASSPPAPTAPRPVPVSAPAASSSMLDLGPPPEAIPELDPHALRPRGSEQWTAEQKSVYRQKFFDGLDMRERTLEKELAAAQRSGDTATEQKKRETLSYLRQRRGEIERMLRASGDAGS
jgi:predicted component of type VI protein secretion system